MTVTEKNATDAAKILEAFLRPFDDSEIKLKPAMVKNNRCLALAYIDARLVLDRLDEVVGLNGWKDEYTVLSTGEVECRLSVRIAGEWITKADVGGQSEQPDEGDRMKAAYSDALKRAAVKFGIGRFLYRRPQEWMDYDPVKKQIVKPRAAHDRPPANNLKLRAEYAQKYAQAEDRTAFLAVRAAVVADSENGKLSPIDLAALRETDNETSKRIPKPAKA